LSGLPPDRPVDGLKDCRIYEAVNPRSRFLVTRDADFDMPELVSELDALGFKIRKDPGRLYGELRV
jgi:hypothetical protein